MPTFTYPDSMTLSLVAQDKIPNLVAARPVFDIFPMTSKDDYIVSWEQLDNYLGLQQLRGLNGAPPRVKKTGAKRFTIEPGVYGEFEEIDERELTRRRPYGSLNGQVDATDLVMTAQDRLLGRRLDRIESLLWTLLTTGTFSIADYMGGVAHTDTFPLQTFSAIVPWATSATATPLADIRAAKLKGRGHSVNFGAGSRLYMNSDTANRLYSNTNAADIYGRRTGGFGTVNSLAQVNDIFTGDNLANIVEYDMGYIDDSGTFQLFIPAGVVVLVGQRPANQVVGEYIMARNANNPDLGPGAYMKVIDRGEDTVPRSLEVHDGHSGAPAIYYPSAIVVMSV